MTPDSTLIKLAPMVRPFPVVALASVVGLCLNCSPAASSPPADVPGNAPKAKIAAPSATAASTTAPSTTAAGDGRINLVATPSPNPPAPIPTPYDSTTVGVRLPGKDICATNEDGSLKNPIAAGTYSGLLRNAVCKQQKFITMARVAKSLGVKCNFCHVPDDSDPNKELYPVHTQRKEIANWMSSTFVQGLKKEDGKAVMCSDCHANKKNKKSSLILGFPRESDFVQEWMGEVMTSAFRHRSGQRLKCKTCHVGMAPGLDGWNKHVILKLQVKGKNIQRLD